MIFRSKVGQNVLALSVLQIANYGIVLATLPVATRALGLESWGRVAFVQVVLNYFVWLTNWGFYLSATRKVATIGPSASDLRLLYGATWYGQWALALVGSSAVLLVAYAVPGAEPDRALYVAGLGLILGNVLFPGWLFNGLEMMREAALIQVLGKLPLIPAVLWFVRDPQDGPRYLAIQALLAIATGAAGLLWLRRRTGLFPGLPSLTRMRSELAAGTGLFITSSWTSLYNSLAPLVVGIISGPAAVGVFSIADRARGAIQAVLAPATQALFPHVSRLSVQSERDAARFLRWALWPVFLVGTSGSIAIYFGAGLIVRVLGGSEFASAETVLRWLSPLPALTALSAFVGVQVMIPFQRMRPYYLIYGLAGLIILATIVPFVTLRGEVGAAMAILLTEAFVTAGMLTIAKRVLIEPGH